MVSFIQSILNQGLRKTVAKGDITITKALIAMGADVNAQHHKNGGAPLHEAMKSRNPEIFKILLQAGAKVDVKHSLYGYTPLHLAATYGNTKVIDLLIEAGANIKAQDMDGYTPLHWAAASNKVNAVDLLIHLGADVNATNKKGDTPLHKATKYAFMDVIRSLSRSNVNKEQRNNFGLTALDCAPKTFKEEIAKILCQPVARTKSLQKAQQVTQKPVEPTKKTTLTTYSLNVNCLQSEVKIPLKLSGNSGSR